MPLTIDWANQIVNVPQSDMVLQSGTLYALDTGAVRVELKEIEASETGMASVDIHSNVEEITIAGVTYARALQIVNGWTITYEDGQYACILEGSNNNFFDEGIINRNQVSVIPTNSAGLQIVTQGSGLDPTQAAQLSELWQRLGLDVSNGVTITDTSITVDGITIQISQPDENTTLIQRDP